MRKCGVAHRPRRFLHLPRDHTSPNPRSHLVYSPYVVYFAAMKRPLDVDERAAFEELLRATKRVKVIIQERLAAEAANRYNRCDHTFQRRYAEGCRDNNEYDLVCCLCGLRA